jgi:hypothetical protein
MKRILHALTGQSGQSIKFAAFVGENFAGTPQHIHSAPLTMGN